MLAITSTVGWSYPGVPATAHFSSVIEEYMVARMKEVFQYSDSNNPRVSQAGIKVRTQMRWRAGRGSNGTVRILTAEKGADGNCGKSKIWAKQWHGGALGPGPRQREVKTCTRGGAGRNPRGTRLHDHWHEAARNMDLVRSRNGV